LGLSQVHEGELLASSQAMNSMAVRILARSTPAADSR
jgi:hypothetical protein